MAFIENDFSPAGAQARRGVVPQMHSYVSSSDNLAAVKASGYFNAVAELLSPNDTIYVKSSGATEYTFIFVAAITLGVVTIQAVDINAA